ncbi:hypothetical protein ACHAXR_013510 [Thalassiosira sp. AJA248-18]
MIQPPLSEKNRITTMNLLRGYVLGGIGLQISTVLASSPFNSVPVDSLPPPLQQQQACFFPSSAITALPTRKKLPTPSVTDASPSIAFASRPLSRYNKNGYGYGGAKRLPNIVSQPPRIVPTLQHSISCSRSNFRSLHPSPRLFMLPEHYEHLSLIGQFTFWPLVDYIYDLVTFMLGLSFMLAAASFFITKPKEERGETPRVGMAASGEDVDVHNDDDLLTPETYADSRMAKNQVKDVITHKASEAFDSTDFAHEPHLSPELEDAETAYEVALVASAAHELADAAEKENRQSKAAMLEREKELDWIEKHEDENPSGAAVEAELFQQSLLAAQLANKSSMGGAKKQEAFHRSLLSARIANEVKAKEAIVQEQLKEEWMGSEAIAASMGGQECLSSSVASVASAVAAHALAEVEAEEKVAEEKDLTVEEPNDPTPAAAASVLAETAERMILGEDIAFFDHSPESSMQIVNDAYEQQKEDPVKEVLENNDSVHKQAQDEGLPDINQWRKDYVDEIRSYMQQKGIEQTKEKNEDLESDGGNVDSIDTSSTTASKELEVKHTSSENSTVIKRTVKRGFIERLRERRRLMVVALAVVICRRLFLAYFGNAARLL